MTGFERSVSSNCCAVWANVAISFGARQPFGARTTARRLAQTAALIAWPVSTIGQALAFLQERHRELLEGVLINDDEQVEDAGDAAQGDLETSAGE